MATAALAALVVAGAVAALLRGDDGVNPPAGPTFPTAAVEGGPLAPPDVRTRGIFPIDLGRPYTWGEIVLRNLGTVEVTLDRGGFAAGAVRQIDGAGH